MKNIRNLALLGLVAILPCAWCSPAATGDYFVYFGTYTGAKSKGIYVARFDSASGRLGAPELAAESVSPSFLAIHPNQQFLIGCHNFSIMKPSPF